MSKIIFKSAINKNIIIEDDGQGITYVNITDLAPDLSGINELNKQAMSELQEYFMGLRKAFTVPLVINGTEFQRAVWDSLLRIPYGKVKSYKEIASDIVRPKSCRAVGNACHNNPIMFIIPCHRVVSSNGLGGFGGGIELKKELLNLEKI